MLFMELKVIEFDQIDHFTIVYLIILKVTSYLMMPNLYPLNPFYGYFYFWGLSQRITHAHMAEDLTPYGHF